jgi:hypothetical protein
MEGLRMDGSMAARHPGFAHTPDFTTSSNLKSEGIKEGAPLYPRAAAGRLLPEI